MKNRSKILMVIVPVLACFALLPEAQAQCLDGCDSNFGTFQGDGALIGNKLGAGNTAFGWRALFSNINGSFNTGIGGGALILNDGADNTAVGTAALLLNTTGFENTAVGTDALVFNDSGFNNNGVGAFALFNNISGDYNNAHGHEALFFCTSSENNAFGDLALLEVTTGSGNTGVGDDAGDSITTGSDNVAVGNEAGNLIVTGDHIICVGADVNGGGPFEDLSNTCYIGSIWDEPVSDSGSAQDVYVDQFNVLGFLPSSKRFKHDIQPMDKASEVLLSLKPVTFKYNSDKTGKTQYGLIAEEVAIVAPDLVFRDKNGDVETVRSEQIGAMLLNEFLKEHKKVEEQQASISQLKSEMQTMVAQLKEQAAQIQNVSAQLEMSKPAAKVVVNEP
jgi:Chaperone of endosialidase